MARMPNDGAGRNFSPARRQLMLAIGALATSGCANTPLLQSVANTFRQSGRRAPDAPVTRERIEQLPYASMGVRVGKGGRAMVVLARFDGPNLVWMSADKVTFVTQSGRLVQTVGLPRDLAKTVTTAADPLAGALALGGQGARYSRFISLVPGGHEDVVFESTLRSEGRESIEIVGRTHQTVRIAESLSVSRWQWDVTNYYWVDAQTGFVWKSLQHYSPDIPGMTLEIFKPAAQPRG